MTLTAAKQYIADIVGGRGSTTILAAAANSLIAICDRLTMKHNWKFALEDTTQTFTVICQTTDTDATVTPATGQSATALKNVLQGMTVTGTGIPASTTVASVTSAGSIELSAAATATNDPVTLTFGGTIPIIAGTDTYTLPSTFSKPHGARLVSSLLRPLTYVPQRYVDLVTSDLTIQGSPTHYSVYTPDTFDASGTQQSKLRLYRPPDANDVLLLRYYRLISGSADPVDVPNPYLFVFLDLSRIHLLLARNATDSRLPALLLDMFGNGRDRSGRLYELIAYDMNEGGEDQTEAFLSPYDISTGRIQLSPSDFYPRGDF